LIGADSRVERSTTRIAVLGETNEEGRFDTMAYLLGIVALLLAGNLGGGGRNDW